jgi:hypothetical protein
LLVLSLGLRAVASRAGNHHPLYGSVKVQAAAILETALLPQRLKLVVLFYRLLRRVTRFEVNFLLELKDLYNALNPPNIVFHGRRWPGKPYRLQVIG